MNIFKNLVPAVAFYVPTGEEKMIGAGIIVPNEYGYSAKVEHEGKPFYIPVGGDLKVHEGETFKSAKCCLLAMTGYTRDTEGKLVIADPKPDADKIWRVTELYK